jgi:dipeptidyl aminopeptidase/acylaminoacyl peptidase
MKQIPYGLWLSPIDETFAASRGRLNGLKWDTSDRLIFSGMLEGESFLYSFSQSAGLKKLNGQLPVGGTVGYGGGDFICSNDSIVFCAGKQGLQQIEREMASPRRLTQDLYQTASPAISPNGRFLAFVASDGKDDQIALLNLEKRSWPQIWIQGADFYMQPDWSPDGKHFAWAEWDHPHMPWESARVMIAELDPETAAIASVKQLAGSIGHAASQPRFSPDGQTLAFIRGNGEWEDLVLFDLESGTERRLIHGSGFELTIPAFAQGVQTYDWMPKGDRIVFLRIRGTRSDICLVTLANAEIEKIDLPDFTVFDTVAVSESGQIAAVAASPAAQTQVIVRTENGYQTVYRLGERLPDQAYLSIPREISWETFDGSTVYGVYYPPVNPNYGWVGLPPAFVNIHGGPTGKHDLRLSPEIQYFTSRGYGWLEVNYRGSSGYGSKYLISLNGNWGFFDVQDAVSGANCIGGLGLADRERLIILGGSAGGYTVLNALIQFPDAFRAGISRYGVADLYSLAVDTHKLEQHYTDSLVGPLPEARVKYDELSPIRHVEKIQAPLAVFQGKNDPVVLPSQSEALISRLKSPFVYRLYENEGHGFRSPETVSDYLKTVSDFARQYLL